MLIFAIVLLVVLFFIGSSLALFSHKLMQRLEHIRSRFKKKQSEFWGFKVEDPSFYPTWFRFWTVLWRILGIFLIIISIYLLYKLLS